MCLFQSSNLSSSLTLKCNAFTKEGYLEFYPSNCHTVNLGVVFRTRAVWRRAAPLAVQLAHSRCVAHDGTLAHDNVQNSIMVMFLVIIAVNLKENDTVKKACNRKMILKERWQIVTLIRKMGIATSERGFFCCFFLFFLFTAMLSFG